MTDTDRRLYGHGTIEPRRGRFRVRVVIDGRYRDLDTVDTREDAESLLRGYSVLAAAGEVVTHGESLRDYGSRWLDQRELDGGKNTKTDKSRWELHVLTAPFVDQPIATIGRRDIKDWIARLRSKQAADNRAARAIGPQTVKHVLTLIRSCLQSAVDDELIALNPAAKIKAPKISRDEGWSYAPPDEQRALLTCAEIPEPERMLIAFAIGTGLREGEIWNLELSDLVVGGPAPHVVVRYGKPAHGATKSGKIRRVPLFGISLAAARRWLELLPTYCRKLGACTTCGNRLAFPTARGYRRRDGKPPRHWKVYLKVTGLDDPSKRHDRRPFRFHDLRHTCASSLVAGWWGRVWQLAEVRDVLGHTSITVTERYAHLAPGVLAEAARATVFEMPRVGDANLPQISPTAAALPAGKPSNRGRATLDSNQWPSASEADTQFNDSAGLTLLRGDRGEILVPLAERYLQAVANRNRFAHRYGLELAKATLAAFGQAEEVRGGMVDLPVVDLPQVQLAAQSIAEIHNSDPVGQPAAKPGLARARMAPPADVELAAGASPRPRGRR